MIPSSDICNHLYRIARVHNGRNVVSDLNGVETLLVQRHEDAGHILRVRAGNYRKNMDWLRQVLGPSRFSEDGEAWRFRHSLSHRHFTRFDRNRTCTLARRLAAEAVESLISGSLEGARTVDDDVLRRMTVSVFLEYFFDIPLASTGIELEALRELMEYGSAYSFVPSGQVGQGDLAALHRLSILRRKVLEQMRIFRDGTVPADGMLHDILAADATPGSGVILEHELLSFLVAGAETTAATMGWALYLLARHPQVQEQLRVQVRAIPQSKGWTGLADFTDLAAFVSEALRLYPPTPIIARQALGPDRIGDHPVAPGHNVVISFVGIQHDARLRVDPWALQIDANSRRGAGAGVNTAFSLGPRVCGGKHFALVELMAFIETFLLRARFELTSEEPVRYHWKAQMLREGGQPVHVQRECR